MLYTLRYKNDDVLSFDYSYEEDRVTDILKVSNFCNIPFLLRKCVNSDFDKLVNLLDMWIKDNSTPLRRKDLGNFMSKLDRSGKFKGSPYIANLEMGMYSPFNGYNVGTGDYYEEKRIRIENCKRYKWYLETGNVDSALLNSCIFSLGGYVRKYIIEEEGLLYLIKEEDSYKSANEKLASVISNRLLVYNSHSMVAIPEVDTDKDLVLSKILINIPDGYNLISARHIMKAFNVVSKDAYIGVLNRLKVDYPSKLIAEMSMLDYIIANEDRHLENFGILENIANDRFSNMYLFDSELSMNCTTKALVEEPNVLYYSFKDKVPLNNLIDDFKGIINYIEISDKDIDYIVNYYNGLLHAYQVLGRISEEKKNFIVSCLYKRLKYVKEITNSKE